MRNKWKKILAALAISTFAWCGSHPLAAADLLAPAQPGGTRELIVLLAPESKAVPSPESVVADVQRGLATRAAVGLGSPKGARLAITERLQGEARERMLANPDSSEARLERYVVLSYPAVVDLEAVKKALAANPSVQHVEENVRIPFSSVPNDPLFQVQSSPTAYQWGSYTLNLPAAWDRIEGHAYVGLTDTGLEVNHPDLRAFHQSGSTWVYDGGNFRQHLSCEFKNGIPCDDPSNSVDEHSPVDGHVPTNFGHGTHTSGILAATANNGIGVAGACQHCSLLMAKVSTVDSTGLNAGADLVALGKGTKWLTDHGVQVISASLGQPADNCPVVNTCDDPTQPCPYLSFYCQNIAYMDSHDVTMFAASGNYYRDLDFPAKDPRVIAVGGIMPDGTFWKEPNCSAGDNLCGSNYTMTPGSAMQALVTPAKQVMSTFYEGFSYFPPLCGDTSGYGLCTGTSMASPYAAAIGGLVRSANPLLSKASVRTILTSTASRSAGGLGWDAHLGYGIPNAASAVDAALGKVAGTTLKNRLTPLFSFYSSLATDSFYTTVPQMATAALLGSSAYASSTTDPAVPAYSGFPGISTCQVSPCTNAPRAAVYIFTSDKAPYTGSLPLVPLYRMTYKPASASDPHRDTTYTTDSTGLVAFKGVGYELDGIEGYIYQRCTPEPSCIPAGAVRLYRLYSASRDDYAIFPESQLAAMQAAGYASSPGLNDWIGYVYPNVDTDGDGLIDGFERLIGTNPSVADSDCDGISDGAEVLNYPYGDPLGSPGCTVQRDARMLSQSVPSTMVAGQSYSVSLTVKNAGSLAWSPVGPTCNAYRLGSANANNWGVNGRADLPAAVAAGQQTTITFTVTAPATPGTYNFQWQMLQECVQWFGDLSPNVAVTVRAAQAKDAQILSQTVPTTMSAGQTYPVSIRVKNVGTQVWSPVGPACNSYRFGTQSTSWNPGRVDFTSTVGLGQEVTLNFNVTAPTTPGTYDFKWQMVQECVQWFGDTSPKTKITVN
jgi:serine protease